MNNAMTAFALGQISQYKLDEITEEDIEKSKWERGKKQVQKEQGMESVQEKSDSAKKAIESERALEEITIESSIKDTEEKEKDCNTTGESTLTQNQTTGKKSRKSTKKTTTTQKS